MRGIPIACTLNPAELADRKERLGRLARGVVQRVELENGVSLRFQMLPELLAELAQLIGQEHECCPFLSFVLTLNAGSNILCLDVIGPPGTKDLLLDLI